MVSLVRFLIILAILAGIGYGGMFALVTFVEPNTREMTVRVPSSDIDPRPAPMPRTAPPPAPVIDPAATGEISDDIGETPADPTAPDADTAVEQ